MKGDYLVPFSKETGNLQSYTWAPYGAENRGIEWRKNVDFEATLKYVGFYRGRSAAVLEWEDTEGHTYPMFLKCLDEILSTGDLPRPLRAIWTVIKRGENYSIQLVRRLE